MASEARAIRRVHLLAESMKSLFTRAGRYFETYGNLRTGM